MTLITGGIKSGKSSFALDLTSSYEKPRAFIATAIPFDDEMRERIDRHKSERGNDYILFEEPLHISEIFEKNDANIFVLDCLTVWLSNLMFYKEDIESQINKLIKSIKRNTIIITNEVGLGVIPENSIGRIYINLLGNLNKRIAEIADDVYLMVSGIPVKIK